MLIDLDGITHHHAIEELTSVLMNKTQNTDEKFFRVEVAYFLSKMASCMRASLRTQDRGDIPVNLYALILATSGYGKGYSINIMENDFISGFKKRFLTDTMPTIAEKNLFDIANDRAIRRGTNPDDELTKLKVEYNECGNYPFTFDSGTAPAVKQLRQRLILANCGAINLQIDEIGSNLVSNTEILNPFLELYDQGLVKIKLTKNTKDSKRSEELEGKTPANMLLFGVPIKLLDGGSTEDQFYSMLEIGYARRCLFAFGQTTNKAYYSMEPEQIWNNQINPSNTQLINKWSNLFTSLADPTMFNWIINVPSDVGILLIKYRVNCEKFADSLPEHEDVRKAELCHRYFKALKLAGALAFIDRASVLDIQTLKQAILLVEESGEAFQILLNREKPYAKLAKYICSVGTEVTHADLTEALPFYKTSSTYRNEMMSLAIAWGFKHHLIIKKSVDNGIEFFKGETLKETNLDELIISYSLDWTFNYQKDLGPFSALGTLLQGHSNGVPFSWCNHHFKNNHRCKENVIPGFNLIVLDIDGGVSIDIVHKLIKEYKFITYTTKRHTDGEHRFRLLIPTNYILELDSSDYREFVTNIINWLPFPSSSIDEASTQISKKWLANPNGEIFYNTEGELLDVLPFIPRTSKNEQYKQSFQKIESLSNLERWFAQKMIEGNRNNNLIRYAYILVDNGMDLVSIRKAIHSFNNKLPNPLPKEEIEGTIMVSIAKKYQSL